MKFVVALFLSSTSAITLNQLQQLRTSMVARGCTGTKDACSEGCKWNGTACATALSQECSGTKDACSEGCKWNGTACAASLASGCTGTKDKCSEGCKWNGTA